MFKIHTRVRTHTELSLLLLPCLDLKSVCVDFICVYVYIKSTHTHTLYTCTRLKWPKADIRVITVAK